MRRRRRRRTKKKMKKRREMRRRKKIKNCTNSGNQNLVTKKIRRTREDQEKVNIHISYCTIEIQCNIPLRSSKAQMPFLFPFDSLSRKKKETFTTNKFFVISAFFHPVSSLVFEYLKKPRVVPLNLTLHF